MIKPLDSGLNVSHGRKIYYLILFDRSSLRRARLRSTSKRRLSSLKPTFLHALLPLVRTFTADRSGTFCTRVCRSKLSSRSGFFKNLLSSQLRVKEHLSHSRFVVLVAYARTTAEEIMRVFARRYGELQRLAKRVRH